MKRIILANMNVKVYCKVVQ